MCIAAEEDEVAVIGDEDLSVLAPIAADLIAGGGDPGVVAGGFDLDCAAARFLSGQGFGVLESLKLIFGEQSAVGKASASVSEGENATDFGFEFSAYCVEEFS